MNLRLSDPLPDLTRALVDAPSVSGTEGPLADAVEEALRSLAHLEVLRDGDAVVARTALGCELRVVLGGHLDTVPIADNLPSRREGDLLYGCGTADMKGGVAALLHVAATVPEPKHDVTYVCYDNEEVEAERNGLARVARTHEDWLRGDLAVLLEPTDGVVEAGCQGTLRADVVLRGVRAHSARWWLGVNAVHEAAPVLELLRGYRAREVDIEGCVYREGLSAVRINGGTAGNVIPDECRVTVNFRFAPDRSPEAAIAHVEEVFAGQEVELLDLAPGAPPGLEADVTQAFLAVVGSPPRAKYGWTDVARFAALGIPALNYGPGDPNLAHTRDEHVSLARVEQVADTLRGFLT